MSDIAPIGRSSPATYLNGSAKHSRPVNGHHQLIRRDDTVQFSQAAKWLGKLQDVPVRQGLVDRVRAEIADGTYETPEKLDAAIDSLLSDLEE